MIGNDIIDLQAAAAESNWRRPGYLGKIFTPREQRWILADEHPDVIVWMLWSAKEAVYKIVNRATHQRKYAPLSYQCLAAGLLLHEDITYYFRSEITPEYIHTIAVTNPAHFNHLSVTTDPSIPYHKDTHGLPMINDLPISISHHGRFYALVKKNPPL